MSIYFSIHTQNQLSSTNWTERTNKFPRPPLRTSITLKYYYYLCIINSSSYAAGWLWLINWFLLEDWRGDWLVLVMKCIISHHRRQAKQIFDYNITEYWTDRYIWAFSWIGWIWRGTGTSKSEWNEQLWNNYLWLTLTYQIRAEVNRPFNAARLELTALLITTN